MGSSLGECILLILWHVERCVFYAISRNEGIARESVSVLVCDELIARGGAVARGNHAPAEEDMPQVAQERGVLGLHRLLVRYPVGVPRAHGVRVVPSNGLHRLDLKAGLLQLKHIPVARGAGVGAGEDVLGHEEPPGRVLPVGALAQARHLHEEDALVVQQLAHDGEVLLEVLQAHVLRHLDGGDALELAHALLGQLAVVAKDNVYLVLHLLQFVLHLTPLLALLGQRDPSRLGAPVLGRVARERSPAAADVEERVPGLHEDLAAHGGHLVELRLLQRLRTLQALARVSVEDAACVYHGRTHEGAEEVVAAVVVVGDLALCGHERLEGSAHLGEGLHDEEAQDGERGAPVDELVAVKLECLEEVLLEDELALAVALVENANGDALLGPARLEGLVLELDEGRRVRGRGVEVDKLPRRVSPRIHGKHRPQPQAAPQEVHEHGLRGDANGQREDEHGRGVGPLVGHGEAHLDLLARATRGHDDYHDHDASDDGEPEEEGVEGADVHDKRTGDAEEGHEPGQGHVGRIHTRHLLVDALHGERREV
mmetsp:Transcript_16384/g.44175  ORF Transcript_16384/g.44175 Transcript_16384/m.44175 type:complete len:542 (+) Transcript_16384:464-2089(+)